MKRPAFQIRKALAADAEGLAALKRATFRETFVDGGFAIPYPAADLAAFEAQAFAVATVAREIADPAHALWLAETDGTMIGYAHAGPCKLPHAAADSSHGELYQLYVASAAQGLGLGTALLDVALAHLAETRPGAPVWLGVWSGNARAQAFYAAAGFTHVGDYEFAVGGSCDHEYILRRD